MGKIQFIIPTNFRTSQSFRVEQYTEYYKYYTEWEKPFYFYIENMKIKLEAKLIFILPRIFASSLLYSMFYHNPHSKKYEMIEKAERLTLEITGRRLIKMFEKLIQIPENQEKIKKFFIAQQETYGFEKKLKYRQKLNVVTHVAQQIENIGKLPSRKIEDYGIIFL